MKRIALWGLIMLVYFSSFAQRKVLDLDACNEWPTINRVAVSNDGRFVFYTISRQRGADSMVIEALDHSFARGIAGASRGQFTTDSKRFIYIQGGNVLHVLDLKSGVEKMVRDVVDFHMPESGDGRWLGYISSKGDLTVLDLRVDTMAVFAGVQQFQFSDSGRVLLMYCVKNAEPDRLLWLSLLKNGPANEIWQGKGAQGFVFDKSENDVAFLADSLNAGLWIASRDGARRLVGAQIADGMNSFGLKNMELEFSSDGRKVFFYVTKKEDGGSSRENTVGVHIFRYNDPFLHQPNAFLDDPGNIPFRAVVSVENGKTIILSKEANTFWRYGELNEGANANYWLVNVGLSLAERDLHPEQLTDLYLCNTNSGQWDTVATKVYIDAGAKFSPGGKYVYWYDLALGEYFVYNIREKSRRVITKGIETRIDSEHWEQKAPRIPYGIGGWSLGDRYIWIYDRYGIWRVDPEGEHLPVDITSGYGRRNKVVLRVVRESGDEGATVCLKDSSLLLCAFDERTKANGFFRLNRRLPSEPVCLTMMDSLMYFPIPGHYVTQLVRSGRKGVFLLTIQSAEGFPNWVSTKDFVHFDRVTDLDPQAGYNWLTSELLHYRTAAGHDGVGILYKPTNFDPSKRYPLILFFYERMSDGVNVFLHPDLSNGAINIPWFVSRGYLVFCPDIHYEIGSPGKGIYDYVVSGAKFMAQKPWVDPACIGIQSHSFGGFEIDYLVTHSTMFAAAVAGAGASDLVSLYGELNGGAVGQDFIEYNQYRMGGTPWRYMKRYIDNSPIFQADKVKTPLLLLNNKDDGAVPAEQGMEMFLALRRMGKRAWLLQYDGGQHYVYGEAAQRDYTRRLEDFFDCYLKKKAMPEWMRGVAQ